MKILKSLAMASALMLAPLSASALSFYGDIAPGDTYLFTNSEENHLNVQSINGDDAGSFSFFVTNDAATTWTYTFGVPFINNSLTGGTFSIGPNSFGDAVVGATGIVTLALAAGETLTFTVEHDALAAGDVLGVRMSAVPLPAGIVLLLSALGATGLMRRRTGVQAA